MPFPPAILRIRIGLCYQNWNYTLGVTPTALKLPQVSIISLAGIPPCQTPLIQRDMLHNFLILCHLLPSMM